MRVGGDVFIGSESRAVSGACLGLTFLSYCNPPNPHLSPNNTPHTHRFNNGKKKVDVIVVVNIKSCTPDQVLAWLVHRKSPGNFYKRTFWREGSHGREFEQLQRLGEFELLIEGRVGISGDGVGVLATRDFEGGKSAGLKKCSCDEGGYMVESNGKGGCEVTFVQSLDKNAFAHFSGTTKEKLVARKLRATNDSEGGLQQQSSARQILRNLTGEWSEGGGEGGKDGVWH